MKLKINKFKSLKNLEVNIPAQITGGNGHGKSTILEAISFVFTGKDLSGNEFKQVYDNRVDIHDAISDVSYFDNYGNEYNRIVQPIYQTNRAGVEEIKIKRSTECRKNTIICNDFSDDFQDFYRFGTDYFFNQKEDLQRSIFIDILKSKLPEYDVNSASLKLKELKRSQKIEVDMVKGLQDANKNTKDVEVPIIPAEIEKMNAEFLALQNSSDLDAVTEINKKNNHAMGDYYTKKGEISKAISDTEIFIEKTKTNIQSESEKLENCKSAKFVPKEVESTDKLSDLVYELKNKLEGLEYFENIEKYAEKYFSKNPVLVENKKKIEIIMQHSFVMTDKISTNCPLSGEFCETAKLHSESAARIVFNDDNTRRIDIIKAENRQILEKEMQSINAEFNAVKSDLQEAERKLNKLIDANKQIELDNEFLSESFSLSNKKGIEEQNSKIETLEQNLKSLIVELSRKQVDLTNLIEPTPEKLPEQLEISDELKNIHTEYEALKVDINKAIGVNENNVKLIAERSSEIKTKQANLLQIIEQITELTQAISDYFSNLSNIVKTEFAGEIEIDVELLEYVMSKDEYKDCFKITANGKTFPYECNGALQNNVKLQILANLQRLKGYTGVTVMDNCEANTTTPINTCGLNCVLAFATLDEQLIIS